MRIVQLTPGTGSFHCGSCLRDNALVKALREQGHDAIMVPLYLPLVTDGEAANPELEVQVGGISLYLAQKFSFLGGMPNFLRRFLNSPNRLKNAGKRIGMTSARELGEMTLGSMEGTNGRQHKEWATLIAWLKSGERPDVISLSNGLLCGLVPELKREIGCRVVVSFQGEDSFLDTLPEPYREQCWAKVAELSRAADAKVAASAYYARNMEARLGFAPGEIQVVPNGLDLSGYKKSIHPPECVTIGYLARMCKGKGLETLVSAFVKLKQRNVIPELRLRIAGTATAADEAFIEGLKKSLANRGYDQGVTWLPNLDRKEKIEFLSRLSVLSVPADYGEAFGLYVIEALACGVPVVQPRHGGFPEILDQVGGGVLYEIDEEDHAGALADALEEMLSDPIRCKTMGAEAAEATHAYYTSERMAKDFEAVCQQVLG